MTSQAVIIPSAPPLARNRLSRAFSAIGLEQRMLLDAAAVQTAADVVVSADAVEPAVDGALQPLTTATETRHVVFIDTGIVDYQKLLQDIAPDAEVFFVDPTQDGLQQMLDALAGSSAYASIQIYSHGDTGEVRLGSTLLDNSTLAAHADALAALGSYITADGDLLLFGCNVAGDADGRAFIDALALLTGADVAASDDLTGSPSAGGDWTLEYNAGVVMAQTVIDERVQELFGSTLVTGWTTSGGLRSVSDAVNDVFGVNVAIADNTGWIAVGSSAVGETYVYRPLGDGAYQEYVLIVAAAPVNATYSMSGGVITVTQTAHGLTVGKAVTLDFTAGGAENEFDAQYTVASVINANSYTVSAASVLTGTFVHTPTPGAGGAAPQPTTTSNITITLANHGLANGQSVTLNFDGAAALHDQAYTVTVVDANTFTVVNDRVNGTYDFPGFGSGTNIRVTLNTHGLAVGDTVYLEFTSGDANPDDREFTVTAVAANTFDVTGPVSRNTNGNVSISPSGGTVQVWPGYTGSTAGDVIVTPPSVGGASSVDVDGNFLIVGYKDLNKVYIYEYLPDSDTWVNRTGTGLLGAGGFGTSVGIQADGTNYRAIVGAPDGHTNLTGTVSLYYSIDSGASWTAGSSWTVANGGATAADMDFGAAVAIDGNSIIVGAPGYGTSGFGADPFRGRAYVYDWTGGNANIADTTIDYTMDDSTTSDYRAGTSVAVSVNSAGVRLFAVGAPGANTNDGLVYTWANTEAASDVINPALADARFGAAVAIDANSMRLAVGAYDLDGAAGGAALGDGQVNMYTLTIAGSGSTATLNAPVADTTFATVQALSRYGASVAIAGDLVAIGAPWYDTDGSGADKNGYVDLQLQNTAPVAANDTASTTESAPVTINVRPNDSDADGVTLPAAPVAGTYTQSASTTVTVTTATPHNLAVGMAVALDYTSGAGVDTTYTVASVTSTTVFTVTDAVSRTTNGNVSTARIPAIGTYSQTANTVTVTTTTPHGLAVGASIALDYTSGLGVDTTYTVASVTSTTVFTVTDPVSRSTSGNVATAVPAVSGTYSQTTTTTTVTTATPHGLVAGATVALNYTSGTAVDATWTVTSVTSPTVFTISAAGVATSGNVIFTTLGARIDPLTVVSVTQPTKGLASIVNGNVVFDPNSEYEYLRAGQQATETLTYTIRDGGIETTTATVTISIFGQNDPVLAGTSISTQTGNAGQTVNLFTAANPLSTLTLAQLGAFTDADIGDTYTYNFNNGTASITINANGGGSALAFTINTTTGVVTFSPTAAMVGKSYIVPLRIADNTGSTVDISFTVDIARTNVAPTATAGTLALTAYEDNIKPGTYSQSGTTTITVTSNGHGLTVGSNVTLDFLGGTAADKTFVVDQVTGVNTFTVIDTATRTTSGDVFHSVPSTVNVAPQFSDADAAPPETLAYSLIGTQAGTYSRNTAGVITVTSTAHGLAVGNFVTLDFTSGTAVDAKFTVATVVDANTFTITDGTTTSTSGNVVHTKAAGAPSFVTVNTSTGQLLLAGTNNDVPAGGTPFAFAVRVTDQYGQIADKFISLTLTPTNDAPVLTNEVVDAQASIGVTYANTSTGALLQLPMAYAGTWSQSTNTVTVTTTSAHGLAVGATVTLDYTSGAGVDTTYTVASVSSTTVFTVTESVSQTASGNVTTITGSTASPLFTDIDRPTPNAFTIAATFANGTPLDGTATVGGWLRFDQATGRFYTSAAVAGEIGQVLSMKVTVTDNGSPALSSSYFFDISLYPAPGAAGYVTGSSPPVALPTANPGVNYAQAGYAVAVSEDGLWMAVGEPGYDDTVGTDTEDSHGRVAIYSWSGTAWNAPTYLEVDALGSGSRFGFSLDWNAGATVLAVGAPGANSGAGAVYTWSRATTGTAWTSVTAANTTYTTAAALVAGDNLGYAVALNRAGTQLVAGAPGDDVQGSNAGAVYLYTVGTAAQVDKAVALLDPAYTGVAAETAGSLQQDRFGTSVDFDGAVIAVGAIFDSTGGLSYNGSVTLFTVGTGTTALDGAFRKFAGAAAFDQYGQDVAFDLYRAASGDAADSSITLVVGAPGSDILADDAGAVYSYRASGLAAAPSQANLNAIAPLVITNAASQVVNTGVLTAYDGAAYQGFGLSVDVDANNLAADLANDVANNGIRMIVGSNVNGTAAGAAYVFRDWSSVLGNGWVGQKYLQNNSGLTTVPAGNQFGWDVAISNAPTSAWNAAYAVAAAGRVAIGAPATEISRTGTYNQPAGSTTITVTFTAHGFPNGPVLVSLDFLTGLGMDDTYLIADGDAAANTFTVTSNRTQAAATSGDVTFSTMGTQGAAYTASTAGTIIETTPTVKSGSIDKVLAGAPAVVPPPVAPPSVVSAQIHLFDEERDDWMIEPESLIAGSVTGFAGAGQSASLPVGATNADMDFDTLLFLLQTRQGDVADNVDPEEEGAGDKADAPAEEAPAKATLGSTALSRQLHQLGMHQQLRAGSLLDKLATLT